MLCTAGGGLIVSLHACDLGLGESEISVGSSGGSHTAPPDASSGSGGNGAGGAGGSACVPACAAHACGDDGCGHPCGPCQANEQCGTEGVCEACPDKWRHSLPAPGRRVFLDATTASVYATTSAGYIERTDACTGAVLAHLDVQPRIDSTSTSVNGGVVAVVDKLWIAGTYVTVANGAQPFYGSLDALTLGSAAFHDLDAKSSDNVQSLGATTDATLWLGGTRVTSPTEGLLWHATAGVSCEYVYAIPATDIVSSAVATVGKSAYVAGRTGTVLHVARYDADACPLIGCANCPSAWVSQPADVGMDPRNIVVTSDAVYTIGATPIAGAETSGVVLQISLATGQIVGDYTWHPSSRYDSFSGGATDGKRLYVSGTQDYDGVDPTTGSGVLLALPLDLANGNNAPIWNTPLGGVGAGKRIAADAGSAGGIYVIGDSKMPSEGFSMKCTKSGDCL